MKLKISFLLLAAVITPASAEPDQSKLVTSYAVSPKLCQTFQQLYHQQRFTALRRTILLALRLIGIGGLLRNEVKVSGLTFRLRTSRRSSDGRKSPSAAQHSAPADGFAAR